MDRFDVVIFDCDGVLVDSVRLAVRTEAQILAGLGWPLSESEIVDRFVGRSAAHMHREVERHLGRSIEWDVEFEPRCRDVFERELTAVAGVAAALDAIRAPTSSCLPPSASACPPTAVPWSRTASPASGPDLRRP
jgi:beta-phosphoglucomutase-like phosphatase (HAD superfamily)